MGPALSILPLVAIAHGTPALVRQESNSRAPGSGRTCATSRAHASRCHRATFGKVSARVSLRSVSRESASTNSPPLIPILRCRRQTEHLDPHFFKRFAPRQHVLINTVHELCRPCRKEMQGTLAARCCCSEITGFFIGVENATVARGRSAVDPELGRRNSDFKRGVGCCSRIPFLRCAVKRPHLLRAAQDPAAIQ